MRIFKKNHCWFCGHTRNLRKSTVMPGHWICKDDDGAGNQRYRKRGSVAYERGFGEV